MRRFFVEDISPDSLYAHIRGEEFIHLKRVLRLTEGSEVAILNGKGLELIGTIESIEKDSAKVKVEGRANGRGESPSEIVLLQGMVKGEKPELIIQKATELGIKEVSFYSTSRTVPVFGKGKAEEKLKRWRKVAIEAAKQCGRTVLPRLNAISGLKEAIEGHEGLLKLVLWEGKGTDPIKEALKDPRGKTGVVVLVGPEGGFSEDEVREAEQKGFIPVSLGPRILRAETAAIGIISIVQYEIGDMN